MPKKEKALPKNKPVKLLKRKLSYELIDGYRKCLRTHIYLETVNAAMGISKMAVCKWMKKGREEAKRLFLCPDTELNPEVELEYAFYQMYQEESANVLGKSIGHIVRAGRTQWQAAAWICERRRPDLWGANNREIRELQKIVKMLQEEIQSLRNRNTT